MGLIDDMALAFDAQEEKVKKRAKKIPVPVTLEGELTRLSDLKWKDDRHIFDLVRKALQEGTLQSPNRKMKKDDIYVFFQTLELKRREALKQSVRDGKPDNYYIVQDLKVWARMQRLLFAEEEVAWDTETTGLDYYEDRIVGISAYMPIANVAFYVPFGHTTGEAQISEAQALAPIKQWLETPGNRSVWHNYKFDAHMASNHDIVPATPYWDSYVVARLLNENESASLKVQYDKYVTKTGNIVLFEDIIDASKIAETDVLLAGVYAAGDPHKTYLLYKFQQPYIESTGKLKFIWEEIESKLMEIDVRMERTGLRVNVEELHRIEAEQLPRIAQAERDMLESFSIDEAFLATMAETTGKPVEEFNFSSNDHLAYLIYDVLKVGSEIPKRMNKSERSTAAEVLTAIFEQIPALEPMKTYRELTKLISTYVQKIPNVLSPDGRLHSSFDSLRTATGRYASSGFGNKNDRRGCNLQNIPARTQLGKDVRKCFIPDDDCLLISSDYSQIEPKIIAHLLYTLHGDNSMRQLYLNKEDLYSSMARDVFGLKLEQCLDGVSVKREDGSYFYPRKIMKTGVLAGLYGQSPRGFSNKMNVSEEVGIQFFDGLYEQFPGIKPFREKILNDLRRNGYAECMFGRKRRFPDYRKNYSEMLMLKQKYWSTMSDSEKARLKELRRLTARDERQSINSVVQGSAASLLKLGIVQLDVLCKENGWKYLLSLHDETLIQIPKSQVNLENLEKIKAVMTETVKLSLPLTVDMVIQPRWMEEYGLDEWNYELQKPKEGI